MCKSNIILALALTPLFAQDLIILNAEQLNLFQEQVNDGNNFEGKTIILANDIALVGNWTPIGSSATNPFSGVFDGQGNTISGLSVSDVQYAGLFGYVKGGQIKNVNIAAFKIKTTVANYAGGLVAYYDSTQPIENCSVVADSVIVASDSFAYAGGLVGYAKGTTIANSHASSDVLASGSNSSSVASSFSGGLVGYAIKIIISDSYASGNVSAKCRGSSISGGLIGLVAYESGTTISDSYASGNVSAEAYYANSNSGGLIGQTTGITNITNSYASSDVLSVVSGDSHGYPSYSGGLIGSAYGTTNITNSYASGNVSAGNYVNGSSYSGGLIGSANGTTNITNSYANGNISYTSGISVVGGIFGEYSKGTMTYVYYNSGGASKATGSGSLAGISGIPSSNLKKQATFINWDFEEIWDIEEEVTYPYLRGLPIPKEKSSSSSIISSSSEIQPSSSSVMLSSSSSEETSICLFQISTINQITQIYNGINLQVRNGAKIEVFDLNGIRKSKQNFANGVYSVSFNHLPKGIYIVKVSLGSEKKILRIPVN
jgi:hypothetical protein